MDKEDLIKQAQLLYHEAYDAKAYYELIQSYRNISRTDKDVYNLSPTANFVIYRALQTSCFMELAKIYEEADTVNIRRLLNAYKEYLHLYPEEDRTLPHIFDRATLHHYTERQIKSAEADQTITDAICEIVGVENTAPVSISVSITEQLKIFQKQLQDLSEVIEHMHNQRNKIYAHNDKCVSVNIEEYVAGQNINYSDIGKLIDFATTCTGTIITTLTGETEPAHYRIDDIDTLYYYAGKTLKNCISQ